MSRIGSKGWFLLVSPLLFGFDWCTKEAARSLPIGGQISVVPGWLAWTHAENPYVAFSIPIPKVVILAVGFVALGVLVSMLRTLAPTSRVQAVALAAITAGAAGNLWDRLVDGTVTDMVRVYTTHPSLAPWLVQTFGTATWPIFNVADACVFCGASLWVLYGLVQPDDPEVDPLGAPAGGE